MKADFDLMRRVRVRVSYYWDFVLAGINSVDYIDACNVMV